MWADADVQGQKLRAGPPSIGKQAMFNECQKNRKARAPLPARKKIIKQILWADADYHMLAEFFAYMIYSEGPEYPEYVMHTF